MILGVYWYFQFPENLYSFRFFKFFKGFGGHTDNDAELQARISVPHPEIFLEKLADLHLRFKKSYLNIKINEDKLLITLSDRQFFDYHFRLASAIENLLILENAMQIEKSFETKSIINFTPEKEKYETIVHRFIQIIGSDLKKCNAENLSVRIDCNLSLVHKKDFISDMIQMCHEENIRVFYYYDYEFKNQCNLMLFLSNGRQTENNIQQVQINSLGEKVRQLCQKYPIQFGHFGGMEYYPLNGPFVELITDEEYILNKK